MRLIAATIISVTILISYPAFAEIKTVTHTLRQPFGGSQSPDDARTAGIARAKREALEQFGTYIESTTIVKDAKVASDEILALTAGVTNTEVVNQKNYTEGDAFGIEITVKVELHSDVLENSLKRLLEDRNHFKDLKDAREREKKLLIRITELEKENQQNGKTKLQSESLKKAFETTSKGLTAVDWFDKAMHLYDWKNYTYSDPDKAIEYLTEAISLDPNYSTAYASRSSAYEQINQFDLAAKDLDKAKQLDPKFASALLMIDATKKIVQKEYESAIEILDQAIHLDPNYATPYSARGMAYRNLKMYEKAIADFDQGIRLDPKFPTAYSERGRVYKELKQYDQAIADYSQAIRLDPNKGDVYNDRAIVYANLKQFARAIADYDQAIRFDPNDGEKFFNRGLTYEMSHMYDRAITDYDNAIRLNPDSVIAFKRRGIAYTELNQFDRAIADFDQMIYLDPNNAVAYLIRSGVYFRLHDVQKQCVDLQKACSLGECKMYESSLRNNICR